MESGHLQTVNIVIPGPFGLVYIDFPNSFFKNPFSFYFQSVTLGFKFTFYGHDLERVTIATGGISLFSYHILYHDLTLIRLTCLVSLKLVIDKVA